MTARRGTVILSSQRDNRVYGTCVINKESGLMITMYDVRKAVTNLLQQVFDDDCTEINFVWGEHVVEFVTGNMAPYHSSLKYAFTENTIDLNC
jgi:hypothetical protein